MPKKVFTNKKFKENEGQYAEYAALMKISSAGLNFFPLFQKTDKDFFNRFNNAFSNYTKSMRRFFDDDKEGIQSGRHQGGTIGIKSYGGDPDAIKEIDKCIKEGLDKLKDIKANLKGEGVRFNDFLDLCAFFAEVDASDYTDAHIHGLISSQLLDVLGCGPILTVKEIKNEKGEVISAELDFDAIAKPLLEPDGKGYLVPYLGMVKDTLDLFKLEVYRAKHDRIGWTETEKKRYTDKWIATSKSFVSHFDALKEVVLKNPDLYSPYLYNSQNHLVDYARDHGREYNHFVAQNKAYENGWSMEELPILGLINESIFIVTRYGKQSEKNASSIQKKIQELKAKFDKLNEDLNSAENDRKRESIRKSIDKVKADIALQEEKLLNINDITKNCNEIVEKLTALKDKLWNLKITSVTDKKAIIKEVKDTFESFKDMVISDTGARFSVDYNGMVKPTLESIETYINTGLNRDLASNDYAMNKVNTIIDIYGPNPKHRASWAEKNAISKDEFESTFMPYNTEGLSFTTKEMAFLGMMATIGAKDKVMEINNGEGRAYEDVLYISGTKWIEDISTDADGPRANFKRYKDIAEEGRKLAYNAMQEYMKGNKEEIAQIIYDGFLYAKRSWNAIGELNQTSVQNYAMLSTFTDLLIKDPELKEKFDNINNSANEKDRINMDHINYMRNLSKMIMDSINNLDKLDDHKRQEEAFEAEIVENELEPNDIKIGRDAMALKRAVYERNAIIGEVIKDIVRYNSASRSADPIVFEENERYNEKLNEALMNNASTLEIDDNHNRFITQELTVSKALMYLGSEVGMKEIKEFSDELNDNYGIEFKNGKLMAGGKEADTTPKYRGMVQGLVYQMSNKQIIKELKNGNLSREEMRELASQYVYNNFCSEELKWQARTGVTNEVVATDEYTARNYIEKKKAIKDSINRFVENMDLSDVDSKAFAEVLEGNDKNLYENVKSIEALVDAKMWNSPEKRNSLSFTSIKGAVDALEDSDKGVLFGSDEYKSILKDMKKLNEDQRKAEETFKNSENYNYNARSFVEREQDLINRLNAYVERKQGELKDRDNRTSHDRMNTAKEAIKTLTKRLKEDQKLPSVTAESLEDASSFDTFVNPTDDNELKFTDRDVAKQDSGMEMLKATMDEVDYQRIKYAKMIDGENRDDADMKSVKDNIRNTIKQTLYYEMLKEGFGPKPNDDAKTLHEKDIKLKNMLKKGMSEKYDKEFTKLMKNEFGERLFQHVLDDATDYSLSHDNYKGVFDHNSIVRLRDETIKECFTKEFDKFKDQKKIVDALNKDKNSPNARHAAKANLEKQIKRIDGLISMAEGIASNALDEEKLPFVNSVQQYREHEAKREARKQQAKNDGPKMG